MIILVFANVFGVWYCVVMPRLTGCRGRWIMIWGYEMRTLAERVCVVGIIVFPFLLSFLSLAQAVLNAGVLLLWTFYFLCRRIVDGDFTFAAFTPSLAGVNQSLIPHLSSSDLNRSSTRSVNHPLFTFSLGFA